VLLELLILLLALILRFSWLVDGQMLVGMKASKKTKESRKQYRKEYMREYREKRKLLGIIFILYIFADYD
jgi:hypothetical protein